MLHRLEIKSIIPDARAKTRQKYLADAGFSGKIIKIDLVDIYTIEADLNRAQLDSAAEILTNPVTQKATIDQAQSPDYFDWAIEIGFLPGVTDNVGGTAQESIEDMLKIKLAPSSIFSSQVTFLTGELTKKDAQNIAEQMANPLINRIHIKSFKEFQTDKGLDAVAPKVKLQKKPAASEVEIVDADDEALTTISKTGIPNSDGSTRGPLALSLPYMKTIQKYFKDKGRNPRDIELESLAQTWSEHCKHTIFADPLDEIKDGLYKTYIKGATNKIRQQKGEKDFCASVFKDNSGAIIFDENYLVTDKVETHNTPSALDPFGGAITGIVGVNRDTIGFGLGAKPIINRYGFCLADPRDKQVLYRDENLKQKMLSPRLIMEGVAAGVNSGGNCSGIPTPQGFLYFDKRYKGKPLVFAGTVGLIPRKSAGRPAHKKKAQAGDYIVMIGGRVGKDGIHGATFSSESLDEGSPNTAVQIGDPITQKKFSDAIVKEARDLGLYHSITDNGAGGLSCSAAEMAKECGGCRVQLEKVPLKYPGLEPWEIWISESQERMTLAVPKEKWEQFRELMERRGVEAAIIGEFTNSGHCLVEYKGKEIMNIEMNFLHDGLPKQKLKSTYTPPIYQDPDFEQPKDLIDLLYKMLARPNIASFEFVSQQYDHEVQAGSVIKPLQGKGRVNGDAAVTRPLLNSYKGVVTSQALNPAYSDIDTYHMAACAIDTAIRNSVAVGASLDHLALLDNFCWCSSDEPERLGQLKRAVKACYDYAVAYGTPFISGKDSMFNDFKGYNGEGEPIKISVLPTLLISAISIMQDVRKAVSLDAKMPGDLVYVLGETHNELGGSEYFAMRDEVGNKVPRVDSAKNKKLYEALSRAIEQGIAASAKSVHRGGLAAALAKTAMAGKLGMEVSLEKLPGTASRDDYALYSESQGRIVATIAPDDKEKFEKIMAGNIFAQIGEVKAGGEFVVKGKDGAVIVKSRVGEMIEKYRETLGNY